LALPGGRGRFSRDTRGPQIRINHRIRVPEVRVVAEDGSNLGVLPTDQALQRAQEVGLDLVEVNPKGTPPVCKILDFGKYKYEEKKKAAEAKRKQTVVEVKEVKIRPKTDDHDINVKIRAIRRFIEAGNEIIKAIEDLVNIEQRPMMEQRTMAMLVSPKPVVFQRLQQLQKERERAKERDKAAGLPERPEPEAPEDEDLDDDDDDDDDDDEDDDDDGDDSDAEGSDAEDKKEEG
jgi:translation initiation factor IF-3